MLKTLFHAAGIRRIFWARTTPTYIPGPYMEVIVRNLDELADLCLIVIDGFHWRLVRARYPALLACLLFSNATTQAVSPLPDADGPMQVAVAGEPLLTQDPLTSVASWSSSPSAGIVVTQARE